MELPVIKTCDNCAYRIGDDEDAKCSRTYMFCESMRSYGNSQCNASFSGWQQRPPDPPVECPAFIRVPFQALANIVFNIVAFLIDSPPRKPTE